MLVSKSLESFQASILAASRGLWLSELDALSGADALFSAIGRGLEQAWQEGAKEAGIRPDERTQEESNELSRLIGEQYEFVGRFVQWIIEHNKISGAPWEMIRARAQMWISRYNLVITRAREMGAGNRKEIWRYNPAKEHCCDCVRLHGRVYRNSTWLKYGLEPQSPALACFGGFCGCRREPTDLPITKGRPPVLRGPGGLWQRKEEAVITNNPAIDWHTFTKRIRQEVENALRSYNGTKSEGVVRVTVVMLASIDNPIVWEIESRRIEPSNRARGLLGLCEDITPSIGA